MIYVANAANKQVIWTSFSNGKKHGFKLFKTSKIYIYYSKKAKADKGFQGIKKYVLIQKYQRSVQKNIH